MPNKQRNGLNGKSLDRIILKEVSFDLFLSRDLLEKWLDILPKIRKEDPDHPEWKPTPVRKINLVQFGYDVVVYVKDESENPTGTFKDRKAWELGPINTRIFAENVWRLYSKRNLPKIRIPRLDEITMGNSGGAQAAMNERYDLPPPKLLIDTGTPDEQKKSLLTLRADIYAVDLSRNIFTGGREPYTPEQIRILTNNAQGHDITSTHIIQPHRDYYDWHVHESFNVKPDTIFIPFGSGELLANYLTWQRITAVNAARHEKDIRLNAKPEDVLKINICAAGPRATMNSCADKLTGPKPFLYYTDNDIDWLIDMQCTGARTGIYSLSEEEIKLGHNILTLSGIKTEYSAASSLGLCLQMLEKGRIHKKEKILIVNTGKGKYS